MTCCFLPHHVTLTCGAQPQSKFNPLQLLLMLARVAAYAMLLEIMLHYQFYYNININRCEQQRVTSALQRYHQCLAGYSGRFIPWRWPGPDISPSTSCAAPSPCCCCPRDV